MHPSLQDIKVMDDADILADNGAVPVVTLKSTVAEESGNEVMQVDSISHFVMDYIIAVRLAVQELYFSDDIEIRMCWWLIYCLVAVCSCIILAWKTYGQEIMMVLACQDRQMTTLKSSETRRSNPRISTQKVSAPSKTPEDLWGLSGSRRPLESSVSAPSHQQHSKVD
ncbi:uncharacterized protein [Diadema setosum]|uniref:uncharacterized protein isoform X1 n=1 Tax=Diadema setosum TaxID=31175 RepID=UPI003B3A2499